jgi:basic membrane protein A
MAYSIKSFSRWVLLLLASALIASTLGCAGNPQVVAEESDPDIVRAAFVYNGPIGDYGWIYSHEQGRKYLEQHVPDVVTTYVENVPEGPEAERVIRDFAIKKYNLIFTTTYGLGDATLAVASEFPNTYFEHATGYDISENAGVYFGRMYQARFLTGLVAGKMTRSNKIGFVAAYPIPQVVRGINAFALGVRAANPDAQVFVVWTNTWFNTVLEREAAESLVQTGVDVLAQHTNSSEPQKVAEENDIWGIGYNTDMSAMAPTSQLTSAIWDWGPFYTRIAEEVKNGTWKSERYWGGLEDAIIGLAPYNQAVSPETRDLVEEWRDRMIGQAWDVFDGPLYGQDGRLVLAEGQRFDDDYLLNEMDWFVQGVVGEAGELPQAVQP